MIVSFIACLLLVCGGGDDDGWMDGDDGWMDGWMIMQLLVCFTHTCKLGGC
jgi:hypothetical protein